MKNFYSKYIYHNVPFYVLTSIAVILICLSFVIPPVGVIDPSILAGVGEIFAFASLWTLIVAIEAGGTAKITHNNTSIKINTENEKDQT